MRNQWDVFDDDNEVEIHQTTSNPIRKVKKKIRRKEEMYKKNPSPELYNEIIQLQNQLNELTTEPVKKSKKKKFKKKRIDKAQKAKEKKWEREKKFEERKEREKRARKERIAEENKRQKKQKERWGKYEKEWRKTPQQKDKEEILKSLHINPLPIDIINWLEKPTRKGYLALTKKYHPDKNNNKDNNYIKVVTSHWNTHTSSSK